MLVGVRRFYLNHQLAKYLRNCPEVPAPPPTTVPSTLTYHGRHWRVWDRLSEQDIDAIVTAFRAGTAKHILAKRYGIAERSLKKLLREEGVKRRSWNDIQT